MASPVDSGTTPEEIKLRRAYANAMLMKALKGRPIQHWTQGLAQLAEAGIGGLMSRQAADDEKKASYGATADVIAALGGPQAKDSWMAANPAPKVASDNFLSNLFGSGKYSLPNLLSGAGAPDAAATPAPAVPPSPVAAALSGPSAAVAPPSMVSNALAGGQDGPGASPGIPADITSMAQRQAPENVRPVIAALAQKYNVHPDAVSAVFGMESNFNPQAMSPGGKYRGISQIGPDTFKEAGGRLAGMTWDEFVNAPAERQALAYGSYLGHYKMPQKWAAAGIDPSKMTPPQQAALLQGAQFAPNRTSWLRSVAGGQGDVPATTAPQARALGTTSFNDMVAAFEKRMGRSPTPQESVALRQASETEPEISAVARTGVPAPPANPQAAGQPMPPVPPPGGQPQLARGLAGIGAQGMQPPQMPVPPMPQARPQQAPQAPQGGTEALSAQRRFAQAQPSYPSQPGLQNLAQGIQGGQPAAPAAPVATPAPAQTGPVPQAVPPQATPPQAGALGGIDPQTGRLIALSSKPQFGFAPSALQAIVKSKIAQGLKPSDYDIQHRPDGAVIAVNKRNPTDRIVIPASPEASQGLIDFEAKKATALEAAKKNVGREERDRSTVRTANIMIDDINRSLDVARDNPKALGIGSLAAGVPGTAAHNLSKLLGGIKANIGFDRLQEMRNNSPTGGALGQVAIAELERLESVRGSIVQSQTKEQFEYNMKRLKNEYLDVVHGVGKKDTSTNRIITRDDVIRTMPELRGEYTDLKTDNNRTNDGKRKTKTGVEWSF